MNFRLSPEDEQFRRQLWEFLSAEWPGGTGDAAVDSEEEYRREREFERKLAQRGWLVMAWPPEYGGQGASHLRQAVMRELCAYFRAPIGGGPGGQATMLVGPAIMAHGSEDQKRRFLPPIARGEVYWCQGFSEPDAGSDLASVRTRAQRVGDYYLVTGRKVWVSGAQYADWMHLLARTDPAAPKHKGLSYLLVDMRSPGITITPIVQMTGRSGFYQVDLQEVRVPVENRVGPENRGWYVALTPLNLERTGILRVGAARRWLDDLLSYLRSCPRHLWAVDLARVRRRLAEHHIEIEVGRWLCYRVAWLQDRGQLPVREASQSKVFTTEMAQRLVNTAVNLLGLWGLLFPSSPRAPMEGRMPFFYLLTVHWTISAGTSEIQRNVIAARGLGLPSA